MPDDGKMYNAGTSGISGVAKIVMPMWAKITGSASSPNDMPGKDKTASKRERNG